MIIDIHAHYLPHRLFDRFDGARDAFPGVQLVRDDKGVRIGFVGKELSRPIMPRLSDLAARRAWMDANAIDHQLVGTWMDATGYELPDAEGLAWSRFVNACMLENLGDERRFTPLATVPLQNGRDAATVLEEAMAQGFGGAMIGTLPRGESGNLDLARGAADIAHHRAVGRLQGAGSAIEDGRRLIGSEIRLFAPSGAQTVATVVKPVFLDPKGTRMRG